MEGLNMEIWSYMLGLLPAVITGSIVFYVQRAQKQRDAREEQRSSARREEMHLALDLQMATATLAYATATAVKNGKVNGEIEEGIRQYERALSEFRKFEREQIAGL